MGCGLGRESTPDAPGPSYLHEILLAGEVNNYVPQLYTHSVPK